MRSPRFPWRLPSLAPLAKLHHLPFRWKGAKPRVPAARPALRVEHLEDRTAPAVTAGVFGQPASSWLSYGPQAVLDGASTGLLPTPQTPNPVAGAVTAFAMSPANPAAAYAATAGGGVWKTTDWANDNPPWGSLTDGFASLRVSQLAVDGANPNHVYAALEGGASDGGTLIRSTDGGGTWAAVLVESGAGGDVFLPEPTGRVTRMQVAGGWLYLATADRGLRRVQVAPAGVGVWEDLPEPEAASDWRDFTDLTLVPRSGGGWTLYAAARAGTYFSAGRGADVSLGRVMRYSVSPLGSVVAADTLFSFPDVTQLRLAAYPSAPTSALNDALYVGVVRPRLSAGQTFHELSELWLATAASASQPAVQRHNLALPVTAGVNGPEGLHTAGRGDEYLAMAVDPLNATVLYLGGDQSNGGRGRIFRTNVDPETFEALSTPITGSAARGGTTDPTEPHRGTRGFALLTGDVLVAFGDGGVFTLTERRLTSPANPVGLWRSRVGTGAASPAVSDVAYDTVSQRFVAATAGAGVVQLSGSTNVWRTATLGSMPTVDDYSAVAIDPTADFSTANQMPVAASVRYLLGDTFREFHRTAVRPDGSTIDLETAATVTATQLLLARPELTAAQLAAFQANPTAAGSALNPADWSGGPGRILLALHRGDGTPAILRGPTSIHTDVLRTQDGRLLIARDGIYESFDGGMHAAEWVDRPDDATRPPVTALTYGAADNPDVIYAARADGRISVRRHSGYRPNDPSQTVSDPLVGGGATIVSIVTEGGNWQHAYAVSSDGRVFRAEDGGAGWFRVLGALDGGATSAVYIPLGAAGGGGLAVGGADGVYFARLPGLGTNAPGTLRWVKLGVNMPNAQVTSVSFVPVTGGGYLTAGTAGRGVWLIPLTTAELQGELAAADYVLRITSTPGADVVTLMVNPTNPTRTDVYDGPGRIGSFETAGFRRIEFDGREGNDQLVLLTAYGLPTATDGLNYIGGSGTDSLAVQGWLDAAVPVTPTAGPTPFAAVLRGRYVIGAAQADVESVNLESSRDNLLVGVRAGLTGSLAALGDSLAAADWPGLPLFGTGYAQALAGDAPSLPHRLFEEGPNGLALSDIGTDVLSLGDLHERLDALDGVAGNVSVTMNANDTRFEVEIVRDVTGRVRLAVGGDASDVALTGLADVTAEVRARLAFGWDSRGFYLDTSSGPALSLRNFRLTSGGLRGGLPVRADLGVGVEPEPRHVGRPTVRRARQGARAAAAGRALQRQRVRVQPQLSELQPVGDGAARERLGFARRRRRSARARPVLARRTWVCAAADRGGIAGVDVRGRLRPMGARRRPPGGRSPRDALSHQHAGLDRGLRQAARARRAAHRAVPRPAAGGGAQGVGADGGGLPGGSWRPRGDAGLTVQDVALHPQLAGGDAATPA